jgi:hypothetical protein
MLAPIAVEHGGQVLRDQLKSRAAQGQGPAKPAGPDPLELLANDVDQLKRYALELRSDFDALNSATAEREEKLRRWLLGLVIWNMLITLGLVVLLIVVARH